MKLLSYGLRDIPLWVICRPCSTLSPASCRSLSWGIWDFSGNHSCGFYVRYLDRTCGYLSFILNLHPNRSGSKLKFLANSPTLSAKQKYPRLYGSSPYLSLNKHYMYIYWVQETFSNLFFILAMNLTNIVFFSVAPRLVFLWIVIVAALATLLLTLSQLINATLTALWVSLFALVVVHHFLRWLNCFNKYRK